MAPPESWTLSDDNFFNNSFENKELITPESLGHGLDPQSRKDLREKHQNILNAAQVPNDFLPLARVSHTRARVLQLPPFMKDYLPLSFFMLFFTANIFEILVENTNTNALLHINESIRNWLPVTVDDIRVFIAIAIYIGLERNASIKDYWNKPIRHEPMRRMTLFRYEQIKRFFHVSNPSNDPTSTADKKRWWYTKLEPVFTQVCHPSI
jgi:hypothetical protein